MLKQKQILDNLQIVVLEARAVTGVVSAGDGDGEVYSSRGVHYINPKALNGFTTVRQSAHTALARRGVRFLSGYAVANDKIDEIASVMDAKKAEWEKVQADFLLGYDDQVSAWIDKNPEVANFRHLIPTAACLQSRFGFDWTSIQVSTSAPARADMNKMLAGLPGRIISEIAQDVRSSWNPSAGKMNAKTRGIIARAAEKLGSLAFLGGESGAIATKLQGVLDALPIGGSFSPSEMALASVVLGMLSSERSAHELIAMDQQMLLMPPAIVTPPSVMDFGQDQAGVGVPTVSAPLQRVAENAPAPAAEEEEFSISW